LHGLQQEGFRQETASANVLVEAGEGGPFNAGKITGFLQFDRTTNSENGVRGEQLLTYLIALVPAKDTYKTLTVPFRVAHEEPDMARDLTVAAPQHYDVAIGRLLGSLAVGKEGAGKL
jgi:hypothetical protein